MVAYSVKILADPKHALENFIPQSRPDQLRGLVIAEPWLNMILVGEKTWELRGINTRRRGLIGLIRAGSGQVVGVAHLTDTRGPFTVGQLVDQYEYHRVPQAKLTDRPKWKFAWVLGGAVALSRPVHYNHGNGPVTWVVLEPGVEAAISEQLRVAIPN